jgi:hypothetical protein
MVAPCRRASASREAIGIPPRASKSGSRSVGPVGAEHEHHDSRHYDADRGPSCRLFDGRSVRREPASLCLCRALCNSAAKLPFPIHPIRQRRFTRAYGQRILVVVICQTPSGYPCLLSPVSQGGAAAPLTLGCGVQPLRGKETASPCELAHQRNRFRNYDRLNLIRSFTFPGRRRIS